jgi:hypothetical protein
MLSFLLTNGYHALVIVSQILARIFYIEVSAPTILWIFGCELRFLSFLSGQCAVLQQLVGFSGTLVGCCDYLSQAVAHCIASNMEITSEFLRNLLFYNCYFSLLTQCITGTGRTGITGKDF